MNRHTFFRCSSVVLLLRRAIRPSTEPKQEASAPSIVGTGRNAYCTGMEFSTAVPSLASSAALFLLMLFSKSGMALPKIMALPCWHMTMR